MNLVDYIVAVLELLLITIVPGFFLSLLIFRDDKFTRAERVYISPAITISLVILIALLLDMVLGVDITAENIVKSLLIVTILSIFVLVLEPHRIKKISKIRV